MKVSPGSTAMDMGHQLFGRSGPSRASYEFAITSVLRWQLQKAHLAISSQLKDF